MDPDQQPQIPNPTEVKSSGIGPLIAIIVILLIIIAGGLYFWLSRDDDTPATPEEVQSPETQEIDEFEDVELDLSIEEFSEIDSDLEAIDQEF